MAEESVSRRFLERAYYERLLSAYEEQYRRWGSMHSLERYAVLYLEVKSYYDFEVPEDMHAIMILEGWL